MNYAGGTHNAPADTKDRLIRTGSKYQATAPAVADGDNVYFLVDAAGRLLIAAAAAHDAAATGNPIRVAGVYRATDPAVADGDIADLLVDAAGRPLIVGSVAHDAVDAGNPVKIGMKATNDFSLITQVANGDRVDAAGTRRGALHIAFAGTGSAGDGGTSTGLHAIGENDSEAPMANLPKGKAPDGASDYFRTSMDSAPGIGALNIAPIGGDTSLRASAVAGEANGTSTAVDNLGWVKSLHGVLDVTVVPSGGTPTLDVYIETQLAEGTWQDIAHFTQVAGAVTKEILAWKGPGATEAGTQAEAAAVTADNYFSNEDAALAATTVRHLPLGDSMRVKWVFAAGGSTGDYAFSVDMAAHS